MKPKIIAIATLILFISSVSSVSAKTIPLHATRILRSVKDRPALAHGVVGFALFGASDVFAQNMETKTEAIHGHDSKDSIGSSSMIASSQTSRAALSPGQFDLIRFLSAGTIGAFFSGKVYPFAYKRLDIVFKGTGFMTLVTKSVVEVFTVGIFANSVSMAARGLLVGKNPLQVVSHVKDEMPEITMNDFRVWFPYNLVAFGMIPISIRPVTTSLMECVWQTYISLRSNDYHGKLE